MSSRSHFSITPRLLAERAFSRTAGAPLVVGNRVDLLIDAEAHFDAWLDAIAAAERQILLENYIVRDDRSEEHTSELQSRGHLVCRLLLEKKKEVRSQ